MDPPFPASELGNISQSIGSTITPIIFIGDCVEPRDTEDKDMNKLATAQYWLALTSLRPLPRGRRAWTPADAGRRISSALASGRPLRLLRAGTPRRESPTKKAIAADQSTSTALVEWLFNGLLYEQMEPRKVIMSLKVLVLKMTYQAKVSAVGCMMVWDVIGQYTPIHAKGAEGVEVPHWLFVWPLMAARE